MSSIRRRTDEIRQALAEHAGPALVAADPDLRDDGFEDATIPQASLDAASLLADARIETDRSPAPINVTSVADPAETSMPPPPPAIERAVDEVDSHDDVWEDDDETRAPSQPSDVRPLMPAATDHTPVTPTDRAVGARIHREARSFLRDGKLVEAERMLGMCIEVADLVDCHRDLGLPLSIADHPSMCPPRADPGLHSDSRKRRRVRPTLPRHFSTP
jgi:hypothetical protein